MFPFYNPRYKLCQVLTWPAAKTRILSRASDGYRLEPMQPQRLVQAAASPDSAAAASQGRAVIASPCVGSESLRRHSSSGGFEK